MSQLRIAYEPDDEWTGKIIVRVVSDHFSGWGSAWISPDDIKAFAKSLGRYPIPPDRPSIFNAGHGGSLDGSRPPATLVGITIKPQGPRGDLLVCIELQTEFWGNEDADLHQSMVARFETDYAPLERFARGLERVVCNLAEEAVLEGKIDRSEHAP